MAKGCGFYVHRLDSRKKTARCSDILEDIEVNTFLCKPCHGTTAMYSRIPRYGRATVILATLILGLLLNGAAGECQVKLCSEQFQGASQMLMHNRHTTDMTEKDVQCIGLRTYLKCLADMSGCKGNINFHSEIRWARNKLHQENCQSGGPVYNGNFEPILPPDELCTYRQAKEYRFCALFGDPHIRTFNNEFQTCRAAGAWPLIDNEHLIVQATNEPIVFSDGATATTKLTVLIQRNPDCASDRYIMYQASADGLPSTFDDGQTHYGKAHSVKLTELVPGKHIEINIKYIDTTILIRQVGSHLTFSIKMPTEIVNSTSNEPVLELCSKGCPRNEIIDYQRYLALNWKSSQNSNHGKGNLTLKEAVEICRNHSAKLVDFYLDACVFDLLTTGNDTFRDSAIAALQDMYKLYPDGRHTLNNRTSLKIYDNKLLSSASSAVPNYYLFVLLVVLCLCPGVVPGTVNRT